MSHAAPMMAPALSWADARFLVGKTSRVLPSREATSLSGALPAVSKRTIRVRPESL